MFWAVPNVMAVARESKKLDLTPEGDGGDNSIIDIMDFRDISCKKKSLGLPDEL